jgi:two-component sensor histidine kinase/CHASE3 domain sensor protein
MRRFYWSIAIVLTTLALAGGIFLLQRTFAAAVEYRKVEGAYARSVEVLLASDRVLLALYDTQRGARGYMLTQDVAYREPFDRGSVELPKQLARLDTLLQGRPERRLIDELCTSAQRAGEVFRQLVDLTRRGEAEAALKLVRTGEGKRLTDISAAAISRIQAHEQRDLARAKARAREAAEAASLSARAIVAMGGVSLLMMVLGGGLFFKAQHRARLDAQKERAEAEMAATLAQMRTIVETVPLGLVMAELPSGRIVGGNSYVEKMLRHPVLYSPDVDSYDEWVSYHADGTRVDGSEYPLARMVAAGEESPSIEVQYQRGDGTRAWVRIMGRPVRNAAGEITGGVVALLDIDAERKATESLEAALIAKDNLLYEVNHRVKNSLQLVVGMLALEAARTRDPAGREAIMSARSKVAVVAQIHQKLYSVGSHDSVDFCAYLGELVPGILRSAGKPEDRLRLTCEGERMVNIKVAAPLGLIVNELTTNALKHAMEEAEGALTITFEQADGAISFTLEDEGPGLPQGFELESSKSMGMKIVLGLVRQVGGTMTASNTGTGARFELRITSQSPDSEILAAA